MRRGHPHPRIAEAEGLVADPARFAFMDALPDESVGSSLDEVYMYSSDSDHLYDSAVGYNMAVMETVSRSSASAEDKPSPRPPLPQRSMSIEWSSWVGTPGGAAAQLAAQNTGTTPGIMNTTAPHAAGTKRQLQPATEPATEPEQEPDSEPESRETSRPPVPISPMRDPRLKLLAPSSPARGSAAARDPRLHLFNRRQRARAGRLVFPATTAAAQPSSVSRKSRAKSPGLTIRIDNSETVADGAGEPDQTASPVDHIDGSRVSVGYQKLAQIERCLGTGGWEERLAALRDLTAIARGGAAPQTIGATLRHVVENGVCCEVPGGQLGIKKEGVGRLVKASRGRTIVRGLEQQLNDKRPMILREAAAAVRAIAQLCGTTQKWQASSGQMLSRLFSMCTLGPKLVCAAADAAVTAVLEQTQPPVAVSVLTAIATSGSMHAARRAHAFGCLARILRCPAWADRPVLARHRSDINAALTFGLKDADNSVRVAARAASAEHTVFVGVATATSPRGESVGRERVLARKDKETTCTTLAESDKPSGMTTRNQHSGGQRSPRGGADQPTLDDEIWVRDVTPSGNVFHYHRQTGEIRTKWSGQGTIDKDRDRETGTVTQNPASRLAKQRPDTAEAPKMAPRERRAGSRPRAASSGPRSRRTTGGNAPSGDRSAGVGHTATVQGQRHEDTGSQRDRQSNLKNDPTRNLDTVQQMSPGSQPLSSHRRTDGPSTKTNTWVRQEQNQGANQRLQMGYHEYRDLSVIGSTTNRGERGAGRETEMVERQTSPRSPLLLAEQEGRIRAQQAAAVAQDAHDKISLELDHVQRQIAQVCVLRARACVCVRALVFLCLFHALR